MRLGDQVRSVGKNKCLVCGNETKKKANKYCSHECYSRSKIGTKYSAEHASKISQALTGKKKTKAHIKKVALALTGKKRPYMQGDKHFAWKGDGVGYYALHDWVYRTLGEHPKQCEQCGKVGKTNNNRWTIQWANKSHTYKRDIHDWIALCRKCHFRHDIATQKIGGKLSTSALAR
jgi:hypothetical protein